MKKDDFERLKAVCEKEGFEIIQDAFVSIDGTIAFVRKKDIWQGVEFAECVKSSVTRFTEGKIYKVNPKGNGVDLCDFLIDNDYYPNGFVGSNREYFKPSTEEAYVEQLKKEAFERFGEIRDGDKFKNIKGSIVTIENCWGEFEYVKDRDLLCFGGCYIYEQGKWAERVKERVKVTHELQNHFCDSLIIKFSTGYVGNPNEIAKLLASQLEKYLNGEI